MNDRFIIETSNGFEAYHPDGYILIGTYPTREAAHKALLAEDAAVSNTHDWLTDKEYNALFTLHRNYEAAFNALPAYMRDAFYLRLFKTEMC